MSQQYVNHHTEPNPLSPSIVGVPASFVSIGAEITGIVRASPSFAGVLRPNMLKKSNGTRGSGSVEALRVIGVVGVCMDVLLSMEAIESLFTFGFACLKAS